MSALSTALDRLEDWWQTSQAITHAPRPNGLAQASAFSYSNRGWLSPPAAPRLHPAVLDAERGTAGAAHLADGRSALQKLRAENLALRARLREAQAQGGPAEPSGGSKPLSPTCDNASDEATMAGAIAAVHEQSLQDNASALAAAFEEARAAAVHEAEQRAAEQRTAAAHAAAEELAATTAAAARARARELAASKAASETQLEAALREVRAEAEADKAAAVAAAHAQASAAAQTEAVDAAVAQAVAAERDSLEAMHEAALTAAVRVARQAAFEEARAAAAAEVEACRLEAHERTAAVVDAAVSAAVDTARAEAAREHTAVLEAARSQLAQRDEALAAAAAAADWERQMASATVEAQAGTLEAANEKLESARAWHAATAAASADLEAAVHAARAAAMGWRIARLEAVASASRAAREAALAAEAATSTLPPPPAPPPAFEPPLPMADASAQVAEAVAAAVHEAQREATERQAAAVKAAVEVAVAAVNAEAEAARQAAQEAAQQEQQAAVAAAVSQAMAEAQQLVQQQQQQLQQLRQLAAADVAASEPPESLQSAPPWHTPTAIEPSAQSRPLALPTTAEAPAVVADTSSASVGAASASDADHKEGSASEALIAAFEAATAAVHEASPIKALFRRLGQHAPELTVLDLAHDAELSRWPVVRQAAALELLQGNPHLIKAHLVGLNLTDQAAPALAHALSAPHGRLEVLNLEQNDLREVGLLAIVEGLRPNVTLRELRLSGQRMAVTKLAEEALASMVDGDGAASLCKLGLAIRNDAARRRVDAALFRNTDRLRRERVSGRSASSSNAVEAQAPVAPTDSPALAQPTEAAAPLRLPSATVQHARHMTTAQLRAALRERGVEVPDGADREALETLVTGMAAPSTAEAEVPAGAPSTAEADGADRLEAWWAAEPAASTSPSASAWLCASTAPVAAVEESPIVKPLLAGGGATVPASPQPANTPPPHATAGLDTATPTSSVSTAGPPSLHVQPLLAADAADYAADDLSEATAAMNHGATFESVAGKSPSGAPSASAPMPTQDAFGSDLFASPVFAASDELAAAPPSFATPLRIDSEGQVFAASTAIGFDRPEGSKKGSFGFDGVPDAFAADPSPASAAADAFGDDFGNGFDDGSGSGAGDSADTPCQEALAGANSAPLPQETLLSDFNVAVPSFAAEAQSMPMARAAPPASEPGHASQVHFAVEALSSTLAPIKETSSFKESDPFGTTPDFDAPIFGEGFDGDGSSFGAGAAFGSSDAGFGSGGASFGDCNASFTDASPIPQPSFDDTVTSSGNAGFDAADFGVSFDTPEFSAEPPSFGAGFGDAPHPGVSAGPLGEATAAAAPTDAPSFGTPNGAEFSSFGSGFAEGPPLAAVAAAEGMVDDGLANDDAASSSYASTAPSAPALSVASTFDFAVASEAPGGAHGEHRAPASSFDTFDFDGRSAAPSVDSAGGFGTSASASFPNASFGDASSFADVTFSAAAVDASLAPPAADPPLPPPPFPSFEPPPEASDGPPPSAATDSSGAPTQGLFEDAFGAEPTPMTDAPSIFAGAFGAELAPITDAPDTLVDAFGAPAPMKGFDAAFGAPSTKTAMAAIGDTSGIPVATTDAPPAFLDPADTPEATTSFGIGFGAAPTTSDMQTSNSPPSVGAFGALLDDHAAEGDVFGAPPPLFGDAFGSDALEPPPPPSPGRAAALLDDPFGDDDGTAGFGSVPDALAPSLPSTATPPSPDAFSASAFGATSSGADAFSNDACGFCSDASATAVAAAASTDVLGTLEVSDAAVSALLDDPFGSPEPLRPIDPFSFGDASNVPQLPALVPATAEATPPAPGGELLSDPFDSGGDLAGPFAASATSTTLLADPFDFGGAAAVPTAPAAGAGAQGALSDPFGFDSLVGSTAPQGTVPAPAQDDKQPAFNTSLGDFA